MQPFVPWPGSKAKCAARIVAELPAEFGTYFEPFLGSGALFFAMNDYPPGSPLARKFDRARLSDVNRNLINTWIAVKDRPAHVRNMLEHCIARNSEEFYNAMRDQMDNPSVFLYVMRAAFSSMYRENSAGRFNVPWRKQDFVIRNRPIKGNLDQIDQCSAYLNRRNVELMVAEWLDAIQDAKAGDLVYFDPPYLPFTESGFVSYVAGGFNEGDHVFLNNQAKLLSAKGVFVALSNSDVPASRRIYGEPTKVLSVANAVKSKATTKGTRQEGLWLWRPS